MSIEEEKEEHLRKYEERVIQAEKDWIYIGEIEMHIDDYLVIGTPEDPLYRDSVFLNGPKFKHFLFKRSYNGGFLYSVTSTKRKLNAENLNPVFIEKDYSVFTVLTIIASLEYCNFRGNTTEKFHHKRLRMVGMENWIETNEDFSNRKINEEDLERLFESDRKEL